MLFKHKKESQPVTVTSSTSKKIGFFSAIMLVIGSCVGAGIFFKARYILKNVHQDFVLSILSWIIAAVAVVAMALALVEVCSCSLKSDKGLMEWNKSFNSKWIYYASKNFMTFLYMPITYFFMPVFACQSLLDAIHSFGVSIDGVQWWVILIISLVTDVWFIIVSGCSTNAGNIQSWIINMLKFFPLVVAAIIGFVIFGLNHGQIAVGVLPGETHKPPDLYQIQAVSPAIGLFCSLSAIFFAYDGFYVAAGIQSEMKEPKKTPLVLVVGLSLVTIFYLLIAISSMLGSNTGDWFGFASAFGGSQAWKIIHGILSILIALGVFGIVNSYAMWTPRFTEALIQDDEFFEFFSRYKHKVNLKKPVLGIKISLIFCVPVVIVFTLIGAYGYMNIGEYDTVNEAVAKLYSFADLTSSWTAVLAFAFIAVAIFGCLLNRKTQKVSTKKNKFFIPSAIVALILTTISLVFETIRPFYELIYITTHQQALEIKGYNYHDLLVYTILTIVVLLIYLLGMTLPIIFDVKFANSLQGHSRYMKLADKSAIKKPNAI